MFLYIFYFHFIYLHFATWNWRQSDSERKGRKTKNRSRANRKIANFYICSCLRSCTASECLRILYGRFFFSFARALFADVKRKRKEKHRIVTRIFAFRKMNYRTFTIHIHIENKWIAWMELCWIATIKSAFALLSVCCEKRSSSCCNAWMLLKMKSISERLFVHFWCQCLLLAATKCRWWIARLLACGLFFLVNF